MAEQAVTSRPRPQLPLRLDTLLRRAGRKDLLQRQHCCRLTIKRAAVQRVLRPSAEGERQGRGDDSSQAKDQIHAAGVGAFIPHSESDAGRTPGPATLIYPEDRVCVDGVPLPYQWEADDSALGSRTYALHKPRGMETTMGNSNLGRWLRSLDGDANGDASHSPGAGLSYIGRLDKQTSGLLLATTDGDFCALLCESPRCEKTYVATVRCSSAQEPTVAQLALVTNGVELSDTNCAADPGKAHALSASAPRCRSRTYRAAALHCALRSRCSRKYTSDLTETSHRNGKLKLSKAEKRLERKRKRKLKRHAPPEDSEPCDSPVGTAGGDAVGIPATSTGTNSGGGASLSPTVHVTYEAEVEVVMNTGQFRVVRRLLAAAGLPVLQLRRTAVGCVSFDALAAAGAPLEQPGDSVLLPEQLLQQLWQTVGGSEAVWRRRLAALRKKCGECDRPKGSDATAEREVDGSAATTNEEDEEELHRLRHWLCAHGLLNSEV